MIVPLKPHFSRPLLSFLTFLVYYVIMEIFAFLKNWYRFPLSNFNKKKSTAQSPKASFIFSVLNQPSPHLGIPCPNPHFIFF
ncbi:MAG TPA: hypothetical protein DEG17_18600 [Cyanobacteria bacterium UBA11149]|nr:hypothetical protein [Cyanobacteria bacterium UBA11366]HBK64994.1 hypothetical protein [Cyanobacteria bacterium UBA11166]HBR76982.1 hypothetical protein [Cyanobacteria bacterium UBA11159]HBW90821.1 hypothetical protein [Cyanobacteria bacterium UBA11149]HCA94083.1 hypothetical protein [Cyanobacteria bacterium UBA9226]